MCPHIEVKPLDTQQSASPGESIFCKYISSTGQHVSDWQTDRHTDKHTSYLTVTIGAQTLTTNQPCNSRYLVGRTLLQRRQPDETYQYMLYMLSLCYAIYILLSTTMHCSENWFPVLSVMPCTLVTGPTLSSQMYDSLSPIGSSTISPSTGRYLASRVLECMYIVKQHRNCWSTLRSGM